MNLRRSVLVVSAALVTISLAACGVPPAAEPGTGSPSVPGSEESRDRLDQQAREALTRWDAAVAASQGKVAFVPVGELTGQIGDWEQPVGDNNKLALMTGRIIDKAALPEHTPEPGRVQWTDGKSLAVPVMPAAQALRAIQTGPGSSSPCDACVPLEVTDARLSTRELATTRGKATVPVWEFTLRGTKVVVTRVAVSPTAGVNVTPPSWDPNNAPAGLSVESAAASADGKELLVSFIGADGPATEPCGADYSAYAVESTNAVVIVILTKQFSGSMPPDFGCHLMGYQRTATATLAAPLGERAVLEVKQGLPVPVTIAASGK